MSTTKAPEIPAGPRVMRREVWVDIDEAAYPGFKAKLWVNFPRRVIEDVRSGNPDLQLAALSQMVVAHNGWVNYDGQQFPPSDEPAFWDVIPDEILTVLIVLVIREAGKLGALVRQRRTD